jgi:hypothetical protein
MNRDKTFGVVFFIFEIRIIFIESEAVDETNLVRIQDERYRTILDGVRIRVGIFVVMKDIVADAFQLID